MPLCFPIERYDLGIQIFQTGGMFLDVDVVAFLGHDIFIAETSRALFLTSGLVGYKVGFLGCVLYPFLVRRKHLSEFRSFTSNCNDPQVDGRIILMVAMCIFEKLRNRLVFI